MPIASYSGLFQPATMLRPARPRPIWSTVAICFAATSGWLNAVWIVAKTKMRSRLGEQPGRERNGIEHALVEVRLAAVPDPARDRKHEVEPDLVGEPAEPEVVVPGRLPAILDLRHRHPGRAVRREQAELEVGAVEQCFCHGVSFVIESTGKGCASGRACMTSGGRSVTVAATTRPTRMTWSPPSCWACITHSIVAAAPARIGAPTSPRVTSRPSNFSAALARELPGERLLVGGQQVQREPRRLEPDVEAARAAVDAPEHERWLLRDGREAHHHEARVAAVGMGCGDDDDARRPGAGRGAERVDVDRGKPGSLTPGY